MRETLRRFRCEAGRYKLVAAVAGIFLSGALLALGGAAWYYGTILGKRGHEHNRQVERLAHDVDIERDINRQILSDLTKRMQGLAGQIDDIASTANQAASTAKSAASTASSAAKNAAQANIKLSEIRPSKELRLE